MRRTKNVKAKSKEETKHVVSVQKTSSVQNTTSVQKSTRSKRFSQHETDLLCNLIVASGLNSMVTNKLTPYGRLTGWNDIMRVFNASTDVTVSVLYFFNIRSNHIIFVFSLQHRELSVLQERAHNIRTGLSKLSQYAKACVMATGGALLPPKNPPKVSFELTDAVRSYAQSLQMKLSGLKPSGDSDELPTTETATLSQSIFSSSKSEPPLTTETNMCSSLLSDDSLDIVVSASENASSSTPTFESIPEGEDTSLDTPQLNQGSSQFFGTQKSQPRKRNVDIQPVSRSVSRAASGGSTSSDSGSKAALLVAENIRRQELHSIALKIKAEELAIKQKQREFWNIALRKLQADKVCVYMNMFSLSTIDYTIDVYLSIDDGR